MHSNQPSFCPSGLTHRWGFFVILERKYANNYANYDQQLTEMAGMCGIVYRPDISRS